LFSIDIATYMDFDTQRSEAISVGGPGWFLPTVARTIASKTSIGHISSRERGRGTGMENVGRTERI
jgi:hypothetical protein